MSRFSVDYYTQENVWRLRGLVVLCVFLRFFLLLLSSCCLWFTQPAWLAGSQLGVLVENFQNAPLTRKPSDTRPRLLQAELALLISVSVCFKEPTDQTLQSDIIVSQMNHS